MADSDYGLRIGKRAFVTAFLILFVLMVLSGILTRVIPAGSYERRVVEGREIVVPESFSTVPRPDYPVWRWFTAPAEVLWGEDSLMIITIILLIILIAGAFAILDRSGILKAILAGIVTRFQKRKYLLLALVVLFFMLFGSLLGNFEEMIPLVVVIVPLAHILGWDSLVGLGMSLLAVAFGFSSAITNPFTLGVAQSIAGLPLFSGAAFRILFFAVIYALVVGFVTLYARRVEKNPERSLTYQEDRALKARYSPEALFGGAPAGSTRGPVLWFAVWIALAIAFVAASTRIPSISFLAFPAIGIAFLIAGVGAGLLAGMPAGRIAGTFGKGIVGILPGMLLILMAMSIKHIIASGGIMDTVLHAASLTIARAPKFLAVLLIYLLVLVLNFFIGSATAKSFLVMPILTPLADLVGLNRQIVVTAFTFGDGFSNVLYPTNALLLIALSFTIVGYTRWVRWTFKLQAVVFGVTILFLLLALAIGYGPY